MQVMAPGRDILIDDGLVHLVVTDIKGKNVQCTVVADAVLGEQKVWLEATLSSRTVILLKAKNLEMLSIGSQPSWNSD